MLDDLRQQANASFEEEDDSFRPTSRPPARFLGMTPFQTFVIALLLLVMTCLLSTAFLLTTGRVVLPSIY